MTISAPSRAAPDTQRARPRSSISPLLVAAWLLAGCGPSREQSCQILDASYELQRVHVEMAVLKGDYSGGRDNVNELAAEVAATKVRHDDLRQTRDRLATAFRALAATLDLRENAQASDDQQRRRALDASIVQRRVDAAAVRTELTSLCGKK